MSLSTSESVSFLPGFISSAERGEVEVAAGTDCASFDLKRFAHDFGAAGIGAGTGASSVAAATAVPSVTRSATVDEFTAGSPSSDVLDTVEATESRCFLSAEGLGGRTGTAGTTGITGRALG